MNIITWLASLNISTILIMVGIAFLMQAWATGIQFLLVKDYRGIRLFAIANVALAVGFFLLSFRDMLPDWLTIVLANGLINLGMGLFYLAVCRFVGRKPDLPLLVGLMLTGIILLIFFTYFTPDTAARILVISIVAVPLIFATVRVLLSRETRTYRLGANIIGITLSVYGVSLILRGIQTLLWPPESLFAPSPIQAIYFGGLFVTSYFWSVGFILMISQRRQHSLNDLATKDPLTHIFNRREMVRLLEAEFSRRRQTNEAFSLLLLDVDHFKMVNDTFGHQVGDFVLSTLSTMLASSIRAQDAIARWGGEEFLVLLPGTHYEEALLVGKRIGSTVANHAFEKNDLSVHITLSIGVACSQGKANIDQIFKSADDALYKAKQVRNAVA